jgi:hypothetical protein
LNQSRPPYQEGNNYNSNFNSNQPSLKDLVLGQAKINKFLNKKLLANDKTLESISIKIKNLSSALKNQLSFNKMIETQLAQIAAAVPAVESRKIPGQPEAPILNFSMVAIEWGNPSRRPSRANHAGIPMHQRANAWEGLTVAMQGDLGVPMISSSIYDFYYN